MGPDTPEITRVEPQRTIPRQRLELREQDCGLRTDFDFLGQDVLITAELIRVSAVLGAFSSLYYAIAVLNDRTYRAELIEEQTEGMRATLAERAEYLRRREAAAPLGSALGS